MNNRSKQLAETGLEGVVLDRQNSDHLYLQLEAAIRENVTSGKWPTGYRLPAYRKLAELADVSVITVQQAVDNLVKDKLLFRRQGQGTFVANREMRIASNRAALFLPTLREPFFSDLAQIIQTEMINDGYAVSIFSLDDGVASITRAVDLILDHDVDGVITTPSASEQVYSKVMSIRDRGIPIVIVDGHVGDAPVSSVECDNQQGMALILDHLMNLGHQRIAFASGPCYTYGLKTRMEAYRSLLEERSLKFEPSYLQISHLDRDEGGWDAAHKLLSLRTPPTAIACSTDVIAAGAMRCAKSMGIRVPEQLSVAGFDDLYLAGHLEVPLTTVKQPVDKIGKTAWKLLFEALKSPEQQTSKSVILQPKLILRASTAPLSED